MKIKKIKLNKSAIAKLNDDEMYNLRGATVYINCTETKSCSVYIQCCQPPEKLIANIGD